MKKLKKVLFSVLAISLLAGCSFNENVDENKDNNVSNNQEKINYENYVISDNNYLKTIEKEITINGKMHKLAFIYSYNYHVQDEGEKLNIVADLYETVLYDGKVINKSFNSNNNGVNSYTCMSGKINEIGPIYSTNTITIEDLTVSCDNLTVANKFENIINSKAEYYEIIKDTKNNNEYLILDNGIGVYYIFNDEGTLIFTNNTYLVDELYGRYDQDGKELSHTVTVKDNIVTTYECCGILTVKIENGATVESIEKYDFTKYQGSGAICDSCK